MSITQTLRQYPLTFAGLAAGIVLYIFTLALNLEVWEALVALIAMGESFELDEFVIPIALLGLGFVGDAFLLQQQQKAEAEKLHVYNHMNDEIMNEISMHLTKLLEFRTSLMKEGADSQTVRHELDRMIVRSFNHYEQAQRRADIDSNVMPMVVPGLQPSRVNASPSQPGKLPTAEPNLPNSKPPRP